MSIQVAVAPGELLDKITILEIKRDRIGEMEKQCNVSRELSILARIAEAEVPRSAELDRLTADLRAVNEALWEIEDDIRDCEQVQDFGPRFIELARAVYRTNDRRAALKRCINMMLKSEIVEEKSYRPC